MMKFSQKTYFVWTICFFLTYIFGKNMLLGLEVWTSISNFYYELLVIVVKLFFGLGAFCLIWHYGNRDIFRFQFKWNYIVFFVLTLFGQLAWSIFTVIYFIKPLNQESVNSAYQSYDQTAIYMMTIGFLIVAPLVEEIVFRGLLMDVFSKWKKHYIDVVASGIVFSLSHVLIHGWVTMDFIYYFVPGILIALYFRKTNCIYYVFLYHAFWNSIPDLLRLLHG